ncbi:phosphopantetheine-binding protein [Streptomyces sp. NPDC058374]|uniref:phosphopantetheine-binding protein n=1 Tax=Streptomyces sp. NPDC058374 TaxID=3346466 RepID=UPI0036553631
MSAPTLPPYMVPSQLVIVDAIPRNTNGKRDGRALLARARAARAAPGGPVEGAEGTVAGRLAELAARVLGAGVPAPETDFFDLGGTSLSAARFVSLVRRELDTDVALRDFLAEPTVAHLATLVERGRSDPPGTRG